MVDKVKTNLNSFTFKEIREIITAINIKGMSKFTKKGDLVEFLIKNYKPQFKSILHKKEYNDIRKQFFDAGDIKGYKDMLKKQDVLNNHVFRKLGKTAGDKLTKDTLMKMIESGEELHATANEETKKLYKKYKLEYVKKLKKKEESKKKKEEEKKKK